MKKRTLPNYEFEPRAEPALFRLTYVISPRKKERYLNTPQKMSGGVQPTFLNVLSSSGDFLNQNQ